MASDCTQIFDQIATKFTQLLYGPKEGDRNRILKALDDLNALNYRYAIVTNATKAVLLVNQCVSLISPDDRELAAKCCRLVTNLVAQQKLLIEGRTLTLTVDWCSQALKEADSSEVLLALHALLDSEAQNVAEAADLILTSNGPVIRLAEGGKPEESTVLAVQCLVSCTGQKIRLTQPQVLLCSRIFTKHLTDGSNNFECLPRAKLLGASLKGLQNIAEQNEDYLHDELQILLGIVKSYMVYGLNGVAFLVPQKVLPSVLSIPEPCSNLPREKKGGKMAKQRKHRSAQKDTKKKPDDFSDLTKGYFPATITLDCTDTPESSSKLKTSDSDFSDTEGGKMAKLNVTQGRVRQAALALLLTIIKSVEKRTIFSYWSSLIPDGPSAGTHYVTTCILKDPSARGRMAALNALLFLLVNSKLYLTQAEANEKTTSFTPLSVMLGFTLKELHRTLSLALNDNSVPVLMQALKCLAALVQATPYHKMEQGLITKIIRNVKVYLYHRDSTVQVAALIVFGCVLASEPLIAETKEALLRNSTDEGTPWILERCLYNLGAFPSDSDAAVAAPVKLESLQLLLVMSRNYFASLMANHLNLITKVLHISLSDNYADLRLHAGRTVDFLGQALNQYLSEENIENGLEFWSTLLNGPLISLLQEEQHGVLRAIGCDCLGSIGAKVFERLPTDKQILCVTLLFACSRDEENSVKGAAVRALAICVLYPSLREDGGFVIDTAEAIHRTLNEENLAVRTKASWALGNLSDALVLNRPDPNVIEQIPDSLLLKLLQASISGCEDNDKIRMNAVRALGNLLQLVNRGLLEEQNFCEMTARAVDALVANAGSGSNMKVRWNACYALRSVLKNQDLYLNPKVKLSAVFLVLTELVVGFKNFKVRINAALALSSPASRSLYGRFYVPTWIALLKALETSQNIDDFTEYKHRDNLVDQVCLGMGHLTVLLTQEDLSGLKEVIGCHFDVLKSYMRRVLERVVPEKATVLYEASSFVQKAISDESWRGQQSALKLLAEVFVCV